MIHPLLDQLCAIFIENF
jgi:hypothetical protein